MRFLPIALCLVLGACNLLPAQQQSDLQHFLAGLSNKITADLIAAENVASAATPVDTPGVNCAAALLEVQADVNRVIAAANAPGAGVVTAAEVASLFQPGSPQANGERDKLVQGCGVKIAQVSGAIAGTTAWLAQLATLFAIPIPGA